MLRDDVYRLQIPKGVDHEQRGDHYGVVVQAGAFLPRSVVIVAPTSRRARPASFRPEVELGGDTTRVLVEQVGAADSSRLSELAGHLTPEDMWGVDDALATILDLNQSA